MTTGTGFKIRFRRVVSTKPVYGRYDEYQVVSPERKIVGRYDMLSQATALYPDATVDVPASHADRIETFVDKRYSITVEKVVTTQFQVTAKSRADARRKVEEYGVDVAAVDYANSDDVSTTRIKSVREAS